MMFGCFWRQVFAVVATVSVVFAVETGHDTCADGRCDTNNLLQKSKASTLESNAVAAARMNTCTFPSLQGRIPEEPWPCDIDPLKFGPVQAINDPDLPCRNSFSNISVLNIGADGTYTTVCRVQGLCLNACGINPQDNFLYCQAWNTPAPASIRVVNAFVRITCPGLDGLVNFDPPIDPVVGRVCYVGGRYAGTAAASFDLEGNYYFRNGQTVFKMNDTTIQSFPVALTFQNFDLTPIVETVKASVPRFLDFTVVPEDLLGDGKMNYLVGCIGARVVIINLDVPDEEIITLFMNMVDGNSTPSSGAASGAQWYFNGTGTTYCAYNDGSGVFAVEVDDITLFGPGNIGIVPTGLVDASANTQNNDGMNCLLATPAPFGPIVTSSTTTTTPISCPFGSEDITFENSPTGQLDVGDNLTENIFIAGIQRRNNPVWRDCLGAAILTSSDTPPPPRNGFLTDGAPLLIFSSRVQDGLGRVAPCRHGPGIFRPRITLGFRQPLDVLSVELWNQWGRGLNRSRLVWEVAGGDQGIRSSRNVDAAVNAPLTIDISARTPPPRDVVAIQVRYGNLPGLKSIRVCSAPPSEPPPPGVTGDPHIRTIDGHHYTLLRQGTFLMWRLTGPQITSSKADAKSSQVDWQLYAHYSGHASYTKGLLLLDNSSSVLHAFELTSRDCKWRSRKGEGEWTNMEKPHMLMVQEGAEHLTSIKVMWNTSDAQEGDYQHVKLKMNSPHGMQQMATLHISCRPSHLINTAIVMERPGDREFVQGQVGVTSKRHLAVGKNTSGISALQTTAQDQEFMSNKKWMELGGSSMGASYLHAMDEQGLSLMQRGCSSAEEATASEICTKHLGKPQGHQMETFADCVYDVCTGGGETAAELLAVVMRKSKE